MGFKVTVKPTFGTGDEITLCDSPATIWAHEISLGDERQLEIAQIQDRDRSKIFDRFNSTTEFGFGVAVNFATLYEAAEFWFGHKDTVPRLATVTITISDKSGVSERIYYRSGIPTVNLNRWYGTTVWVRYGIKLGDTTP